MRNSLDVKYAKAFITKPNASERVTDFLVGAITIVCSGLVIWGTAEGLKGVVDCYTSWRKQEIREIDLELGNKKAAQEYKAS